MMMKARMKEKISDCWIEGDQGSNVKSCLHDIIASLVLSVALWVVVTFLRPHSRAAVDYIYRMCTNVYTKTYISIADVVNWRDYIVSEVI